MQHAEHVWFWGWKGLGGGQGGRGAQSNLDTAGESLRGESLQLWGISGTVHGLKAPPAHEGCRGMPAPCLPSNSFTNGENNNSEKFSAVRDLQSFP